jgi:cytochrome c
VKADFAWDDARLDAWLANPEAIIPGDIVAYRHPKRRPAPPSSPISRS